MTSIIKTIPDPILGERALTVHPPISPGGDDADFEAQGWGRRTRYVPGRSVTERALQTDQRHVAGHIPTAGQRLAAGVVVGLEVAVEGTRAAPVLHIAPGMGVCLNGEDVRIPHPVELDANVLLVANEALDEDPRPLSEYLAEDPGAGRAVIVQLRPVVVERTGDDDPDDPCEIDPEMLSFTDEQLVDGCRVRLYPLEIPLEIEVDTWRNEIAYSVFDREARDGLPQVPWQAGGLPIAVLGFPPGGADPYVDVHAAARRGGHANPRRSLLDGRGTPALWQARFEQFIDQIRDIDIEQLTTDGLGSRFQWLPPVGMLPPGTINVRGDIGEPDFPLPAPPIFPEEYVVEAVPVELEALDDYLQAGASLAPFDTQTQEQVQVLVPVPQQHFDPDLLVVEDETPDEFNDAIERFLLALNHRLGRRYLVRASQRHLGRMLYGAGPPWPDEPLAVQGEVSAFFPPDHVLAEEGLPVPPPETLVGSDITPRIRALATALFTTVGGPNEYSDDNPLSVLMVATMVAPEGDYPGTQQNSAEELFALFADHRFGGKGLVGFSNACLNRLVIASERITLAFERLQAELHRVRQYVSGTQVANQLAISPVVSAIAVRDPTPRAPLTLSMFASNLRDARESEGTGEPTQPDGGMITTIPTTGIPTGGKAIPSSILFSQNILERLDSSPPAFDASASADRATREALRTVLYIHDELGLSLDGIRFPDRLFNRTPGVMAEDLPPGAPIRIREVRLEISRWLEDGFWPHEFDEQTSPNEASFFANAVRRLEEMVAVLRIAEARLTAYETAVELMRTEIDHLRVLERSISVRLAELQDEIDELRHDVRVARALEREQMERAVRLNALRRDVIAEHVPFLVFRRPRSVEALRTPPSVPVEPALDSSAVPDCLDDEIVPPEQLGAMLDLIREMPVNRLKIGPSVVRRIDKRGPLLALADLVLHAARTPAPRLYHPFDGPLFTDRIGGALKTRYAAHREAAVGLRSIRDRRLSQAAYRTHSWSRLQSLVQQNATIADVLNAPHGKLRHAQRLSRELDDITRVAACLYEHFKAVPPIVRLHWVEQVSEEDENVGRLDDLSVLPDWESVDRLDRRDLQALIDWLFDRFDPSHDDGIAYVSDLVRVALLLSGHAPVQQVLDAVVVAPQPVEAGGFIRLQLDPSRLRVGMHVALFGDSARKTTVGSGLVDDLADGVVAVKIVSTVKAAAVVPTHALVSEPTMGPRVTLAGGQQVSIGLASKLS